MQELPDRQLELPGFPDWHNRAACRESEALFFFSPDSSITDQFEKRAVVHAKLNFCDYCPVLVQCLESALMNGDVGIWAGTTTYERNQLRRTRNRAKCPVCKNRKLIKVEAHSLCLACGLSWNNEDRLAN